MPFKKPPEFVLWAAAPLWLKKQPFEATLAQKKAPAVGTVS